MIRDALISDVHDLAPRLREADALEMTALGEDPAECLRHSWAGSPIRRAVEVDGKVAALWGVYGDLFGGVGIPWFLTAPEIERIPVTMVRQGRAEVSDMLGLYPRLENYVAASYRGAVRFVELLGFTVDAEIAIRGTPFRRFWMKESA